MHSSEDIATTPRETEKKKKIFHGWYIIAAGFLANLAGATYYSSTLGVFFKPMSEEFGWPRTFLSGLRSFESLSTGFLGAFLGPFLDRHGARSLMVAGGVLGGIGLILLGWVNDSLQFVLVRTIIVCVGMAAFNNLVVGVAVSNWFVLQRGRAIGLSGSGGAVGKVFLAPLITLLMAMSGWRIAWIVLGVMVLILVPLPAALIIRRRPEDMGLRPDGAEQPTKASRIAPEGEAVSRNFLANEAIWTRSEAIHTSAFWLIILTFGVANVGSQGLALHTIPYLTDIGFTPAMAAGALSILSVFQLIGTIGWGFVVERFPIRYCAVVMFLSEAAGVAVTLWLREPLPVTIGLIAYGFSLSGTGVLQDIIWANYFGRLSLGAIRSIGMPLLVLFSAVGPLYFGYLYDVTGNYSISLFGFIVALTVAAGLVLACHPPTRQPQL